MVASTVKTLRVIKLVSKQSTKHEKMTGKELLSKMISLKIIKEKYMHLFLDSFQKR
jgi:hypothetical protein